jgi:HTH domain
MNDTLEMKELAKILHCSVRTIQRSLERLEEHPDLPNLLPPGKKVGVKWIWLKSVVIEWLSPQQPACMPAAGSLAELATHQLIQNKTGLKK